jgi:hypothetical protein
MGDVAASGGYYIAGEQLLVTACDVSDSLLHSSLKCMRSE